MSKQLYVPYGANIEQGLDIKGGVTADSILVNGAPISGFGSDVTVNIANSALVNVKALQLVTSLTTSTAGSEVSQLVASVLVAGAQVSAFTATGNAFLGPLGTIALPGLSFQGHANAGMSYVVGTGLFLSLNGVQQLGLLGNGLAVMNNDAAQFQLGSAGQGFMGMIGLDYRCFSSLGNVVIGTDGAVATGSATLHLTIPTCAGAPTGTVVPRSGKAAIIIDTAAAQMKFSTGGGTWSLASGATNIANGAVASVMTANVGPTGANTAIQRWRKEPDGAGGFWLTPSWL